MRVADSSFIVEGLLKRKELLEEDLLTLELALYETANSIWKHQIILKDFRDGMPYLNVLLELIQSGRIRVVRPGSELMKKAYSMAFQHNRSIYDTVFVALASELGLKLATFDRRQAELMRWTHS